MNSIELAPIRETDSDFALLEERIRWAFFKCIYQPLLKELELKDVKLVNAKVKKSALQRAIETGQVTYRNGVFSGKFNAEISKELRAMGAYWGKGVFDLAKLPADVSAVVSASEARFRERLERIDVYLQKNLPEEIAGELDFSALLDSALWRVDKEVRKSVRALAIVPTLEAKQTKQISEEWSENLKLWIKDFTAEEIKKLRKDVERSVFHGNRHDHLTRMIRRSYGVSAAKAKFLARQETSLLMTKFKETRYTSAGITKYRWACVVGSKNHPVRAWHKALEGKVFSWDSPPITTKPGEPQRRNNPGQDYNCRCFAIPLIERPGSRDSRDSG